MIDDEGGHVPLLVNYQPFIFSITLFNILMNNAFDVLEQEGFLDSLPYTYRIIYLRINTSPLLRSWILFQCFCLNIPAVRFDIVKQIK